MGTHENMQILLQDLSARIPYGVICKWKLGPWNGRGILTDLRNVVNEFDFADCYIQEEESISFPLKSEDRKKEGISVCLAWVYPYLRPMSSMTEEEEIEYNATFATIKIADGYYVSTMTYKSFDWLNAHHFDYRGLIEKGLALKAPKGMYQSINLKIKELWQK